MSTISTSDSSLREQLTKEVTWTNSCLRKRNAIISKLKHHIQQKNREKATSLFKRSVSKYHKTFQTSRKELYEWYSSRTEYSPVRRYPSSFKQKVINEVQLGNCKSHVAEKYGLCYQTLNNWTKKACNLIPKIKKPEKRKKYSPDFKRKIVSEVCLGKLKATLLKNIRSVMEP